MSPTPKQSGEGHSIIPAWCVIAAPGRVYARFRLRRALRRTLRERDLTLHRVCYHFAVIEGKGVAAFHFEAGDELEASLAGEGTER